MKEGVHDVKTEEHGDYSGFGVCHHWRVGAVD